MRPWNTTFFCAMMSLIVFRQNLVEDRLQILRERRLELHFPPVRRMMKHQSERVKERPIQGQQRTELAHHTAPQPSISGIAHDGMPDFAEMHPDLVRAAGVNGHVNQRDARKMQ